jgi:hypothetical protein
MEVEKLKSRILELENEVAELKGNSKRGRIEKMSAEVVDSNPYRWAETKTNNC